MKITTLMESYDLSNKQILRESCDGLTKEQRYIVENIYKEMKPLIEASLTADQIKQLFGAVEKEQTASGGNRTVLGKGVDVAKKANEIVDNIGKWLQNTTPVKNFDAKFDKLKSDINKKFPDSKILDAISEMGMWAKENPGKTAAIVGVLTAIASLAAGPVGGAIAGQVLRGSVELLKGEKLSTAIGKGIKTAAFGYLSGKAFEMLGDFAKGIRLKSMSFGPENAGFEEISFGASKTLTAPGTEWTETIQGVDIIVDPEMASAVRSATNMIRMGGEAATEGFDQLQAAAEIINSQEYRQNIIDTLEISRQELLKNDSLLNFIKTAKEGLQAASQGAVAGAGVADGKKESKYVQGRPLSEGQVYLLFSKIERLDEGPMDLLKKGADWAKTKAGNLTTKITADKLVGAWKKAGSPTDTDELASFLEKQGVNADVIKSVYTGMKLPEPGKGKEAEQQTAQYDQVMAMINKLPTDRKVRLLKYLTTGKGADTEPAAQG